MYSDRRGNGQKPPRTKPSRQKTPDKTPGQKPPRTTEREFVQRAFVRVFVLGLLKIRGGESEMCGVLLGDVPGCVTKWDRGGGSKLAKYSVTYFMDGLFSIVSLSITSLYYFLKVP